MRDVVNTRVKLREEFRPFAPAALAEYAGAYFDMRGVGRCDFMEFVVPATKLGADSAKAVVHIDGSARLQTVDRADNEPFWQVIEAFRQRTGVPIVLNTSFNVRGEPIVCTPEDAIRCFLSTDIDVLVMEGYMVAKKAGKVLEEAWRARLPKIERPARPRSPIAAPGARGYGFIGLCRAANEKSLSFDATGKLDELELLDGFYALGRGRDAQGCTQRSYRLYDGGTVGAYFHIGDEGLIDFDLVEREAAQITQRRIARAEVVHGDAHAIRGAGAGSSSVLSFFCISMASVISDLQTSAGEGPAAASEP